MKKLLTVALSLVLLLALGIGGLFVHGYWSARSDAPLLAARANALAAAGRTAEALGPGRARQLLAVEDPGFATHDGIDLASPGAGFTTLTQGLAKKVGFSDFKPGWRKFRLMGYAAGLERSLTKSQILTLFLDRVPMGRDRSSRWMEGYFTASDRIYGKPPSALTERQFLTLVAVGLAPVRLRLAEPSPELHERVTRIERLVHGRCRPAGLRDVELKGCAAKA